MEMDLTAAGPPISDDDSELEETERKFVKVSPLFLFENGLRIASKAIFVDRGLEPTRDGIKKFELPL